ncbi:hypothetical protein [Magnetospirillum fulvum]|uniref:Uncharacterized protein n=1 Tax=Magnetospirillum fulvum MGU-K5 TaxID=1316936 RepID=S9S3Z1_MAGFU|nr:hypothetical protein [Magnetospirillum fulvum]EPY00617.1 hypothetical protein K678_15219 [Magnetospirillum fulvum MGU-K5]
MTAALAPVADRLQKLIPRLASDHDGEVLATVAAIRRTLGGANLTLHDLARALAAAPPRHEARREIGLAAMLDRLRRAGGLLNVWESRFVADLSVRVQRGKRLSPKQAETLRRIYEERIGSKP